MGRNKISGETSEKNFCNFFSITLEPGYLSRIVAVPCVIYDEDNMGEMKKPRLGDITRVPTKP